jgi:hypothetical protein
MQPFFARVFRQRKGPKPDNDRGDHAGRLDAFHFAIQFFFQAAVELVARGALCGAEGGKERNNHGQQTPKAPSLSLLTTSSRQPGQFKCSIVSGLFFYLGVPVLVLRIWSNLRTLVLPDSFERP